MVPQLAVQIALLVQVLLVEQVHLVPECSELLLRRHL
jgi:hypothetical protein